MSKLFQIHRSGPGSEIQEKCHALMADQFRGAKFDLMSLCSHRVPPLLPATVWVYRVKPLLLHRGLLQLTEEYIGEIAFSVVYC
jgi:hypothetical protein